MEVVVGDLDNRDSLVNFMRGGRRLFLITSSTQQDLNAIAVAQEAGIKHVVKISTQEAGWTPVRGHGRWHKEREDLIRASGLAWTFLRPSMYMSTALTWAETIRREQAFHFAGGNGRLGAIDPADVAAVAKIVLTTDGHENKGYELTGPEMLNFQEMAGVFSKVLGRTIRHVDLTEAAQAAILTKMGLPEYTVDGLMETFALVRAGRFAYLTDDFERVTGNSPRTFEAWLRNHIAAFG